MEKNAGCFNCTGNVNRPHVTVPPLCERFTAEGYYYDSGEIFTKYGECYILNKNGDCSGFELLPKSEPTKPLTFWESLEFRRR